MKGTLVIIAITIVIMLFLVSATTRSAIYKDAKVSLSKIMAKITGKTLPNQVIPASTSNITFNASIS